jgi:hypothetical protein
LSYDGTLSGSADDHVSAENYSLDNCVGLGQTDAIYTAGLACQAAGIAAGLYYGRGYAVVSWDLMWWNDAGNVVEVGPMQQQYDCGDTF